MKLPSTTTEQGIEIGAILSEIADKKQESAKLNKFMHVGANESVKTSLAVGSYNIGRNYISALIDGARQNAYSGENKNIKSKIKSELERMLKNEEFATIINTIGAKGSL